MITNISRLKKRKIVTPGPFSFNLCVLNEWFFKIDCSFVLLFIISVLCKYLSSNSHYSEREIRAAKFYLEQFLEKNNAKVNIGIMNGCN